MNHDMHRSLFSLNPLNLLPTNRVPLSKKLCFLMVFLLGCTEFTKATSATWFVRRAADAAGVTLTYGTGNGKSYDNAWAGCAAIGSVAPGDTIELDSIETWYERCEISVSGQPGASITVRGLNGRTARFEHTVSIDGPASFSSAGTWVPAGYPWTQIAGTNIWRKTLNSFPYQATEDGNLLKGVNCNADDEPTALSKLSPGTFCKRNTTPNLFYYRPTFRALGDHQIRVSAHNDDNKIGLFFVNGSQYMTLSGLSLRYHVINSNSLPGRGALALLSPDYLVVKSLDASYNFDGISIDSGTHISIEASVNASYNTGAGISIDGHTDSGTTGLSDITISSTTNYNGRNFQYNTNQGYHSDSDGDGIGIGHQGGFGKSIRIAGATSCYNGSPDSSSDNGGSGIEVSTSDFNAGFVVHVLRSKLCYNHGPAFLASDDWISGDFVGNRVFENCRGGCIITPQALTFRNEHPSYFTSTIANNEIWNNYGSQALYIFNTAPRKSVSIRNNIIRNTSASFGVTQFKAEITISAALDNVLETGNTIRSKSTLKAIKRASMTYSESQITNGQWDAISPLLGAGTVVSDPPWAGGNNPNNE
jgi:hypothetical protein